MWSDISTSSDLKIFWPGWAGMEMKFAAMGGDGDNFVPVQLPSVKRAINSQMSSKNVHNCLI